LILERVEGLKTQSEISRTFPRLVVKAGTSSVFSSARMDKLDEKTAARRFVK
jgi:hypothetical protein